MKKTISKDNKRGRKAKTSCTALVLLDSRKIKNKILATLKRRQKTLANIEIGINHFLEVDQPEYEKFLAQSFGSELTQERELYQEIQLLEMRYAHLNFLAEYNRMTVKEYGFLLRQKVADDADVWDILADEIDHFHERAGEAEDVSDTDWSEDAAADDEFEDEEFDDGNASSPKDFFSALSDFFGIADNRAEEAEQLKKIYRNLCLRFHPDHAGQHDAETKKVWNQIQEAYQDKDLLRLRAIDSGLKLNSDKDKLCCWEMDEMILEIDWRIADVRSEIRSLKKKPWWDFSNWSAHKRKSVEKEIQEELRCSIITATEHRNALDAQLHSILNDWKPKKRRHQSPKKGKTPLPETPKLFKSR